MGGDTVGFTPGTGTMANPYVGSSKAVTASIALDSANYTLTQPTGITVDVTPAELTVTGFNISKQFDNNAAVLGFGTLVFSNLQNGETADVDYSGITATYDNANILNNTTGKAYEVPPMDEYVKNILQSGGLIESLRDSK